MIIKKVVVFCLATIVMFKVGFSTTLVNGIKLKRSLILSILICYGCLNPSFAETFGSYEYTINGGEITITKFLCNTANALIPASIGEVPVTSIGNAAFYQCTKLTSVTIPNSVVTIGSSAFSNCSNLTSVTIPNSVTSIGDGAFSQCTSLTSVTISDNVTAIGNAVFLNCTSLISVTIPNSVTYIGINAFSDCVSLTSVTIPSSVTSIEQWAFRKCTSLTSVTIPNSVIFIGYAAFTECSSLTSVTIPNGVTSIQDYTFSDCISLASVTIPDSVTSIGFAAFTGCNNLISVTVPESVISISDRAFSDCIRLTSVIISKGVTTIGELAFADCSNLIRVYFLGMPPALDYGVFFYTNSEITIYYLEGTPGWGSTFGDRPTSPFIPWGMFVSFSSDQYTYADTGNWLGILEITHDPWVWCAWVPCWFSIPAQTANSGRGWVYPPDPVTLQIVPIDGTNWGYSFALYKWLYLTASGWVYLM